MLNLKTNCIHWEKQNIEPQHLIITMLGATSTKILCDLFTCQVE